MGLKNHLSVVADSEVASSPRSSASSPAPIKRATRTYGRGRDIDNSFTYSEQDSKDSIYRTGPPGMFDEVPPSEMSRTMDSDGEKEGDDDDAEEVILPSSMMQSNFTFGWREKLKELDDQDDFDERANKPTNTGRNLSGSLQKAASQASSHVDTDVDSPVKNVDGSINKNTVSGDLFGGSLLSLTSPSLSTNSRDRSSPTPSRKRSRAQKNVITSDDEMEQDKEGDSRPSSPTTSPLHPIATPESQFASSPPTSHHDDVSANSTSSSASKGKGKASRARHSVAPLRFDSHRPNNFGSVEDVTRSRSFGQRVKKQKVKAPTKKELRETARERARLAAEQTVSIPRAGNSEGRSLASFFSQVAKRRAQLLPDALQPPPTGPPSVHQPSSPIDDFSSSQPREDQKVPQSTSMRAQTVSPSRQSPSPQRSTTGNARQALASNSDSDGLPDVGILLNGSKAKKQPDEVSANRQSLAKLKQQLASAQALKPQSDDEDDGIDILPPKQIDQQRKSVQKKQLSTGQKMLLANARVKAKPLAMDPRKSTKQDLDLLQEDILKRGTSDPRVLTTVMRQRAERESMNIVKQKEEEFIRLGGTVKRESGPVDETEGNQIILEYAKKGVQVWSKKEKKAGVVDVDDDKENDSDWLPETQDSMSPMLQQEREQEEDQDYESMELNEAGGGEAVNNERESEREELSKDGSDDENEELPVFKGKTRKNRSAGRIADSDDSDSGEYDNRSIILSKSAGPRYPVSSSDDRTEDENDKENNTRLMFDRGEDKENKAVVRHKVLGGASGSVRSLHSIFDGANDYDRDLSLSPPHVMTLELEAEVENVTAPDSSEKREPLGVIGGDGGASLQRSSSTLTQVFAAQLKHSSPIRASLDEDVFGPTGPASTLKFAPVFDDDHASVEVEKPALGFSQFSQEGPSSLGFGAPGLLQTGFVDLFESKTQKGAMALRALRREESLGLTQDVALQPAFQVDERLLRKADAIFEKEQEYVVENAGKRSAKEPELYVNDVGFLTQTRPSASRLSTRSPSFVLSPTQTPLAPKYSDSDLSLTQTQLRSSLTVRSQSSRPPLRTISLSNPQFSSPEASPKRRLRKRGDIPTPVVSPAREAVSSTAAFITSPLQQRNAFDILGKRPQFGKEKGADKSKGLEVTRVEKMIRKEYMMEEAEESDEEQAIGFGLVKGKDREEDEEGVDLDASLPELVDDQNMDDETAGAEKVLEKHQELLERDDEEALKFHQGVVQGELRKKRKGRFGIDDSDEEDEEDDRARRIRRRMKERRERGDIQELAADKETAAFASVYQAGIQDDEAIVLRPLDLEHELRAWGEGEDEEDAVMDGDQGDEPDEKDGQDEEDVRSSFVTYKDIQAEVRKMKEHPEEEMETHDYGDVSWIDTQDVDGDEMNLDVEVVTGSRDKKRVGGISTAKSTPVGDWDLMMLGGVRRKENEKDIERSRTWAKNESRNMTRTTGRVVGGIAVTGHGNNRTKDGGGSLRSKSLTSTSVVSSSSLDGKNSLRAQGSVLANLSKRKDQFQ